VSVYCSTCNQRGHNRRSRAFHPTAKPLIKNGDRRGYDRQVYDQRYDLRKAVRNECRCGAEITEKGRAGWFRSLCRECLDKNAARKRRDAEELKRLRMLVTQSQGQDQPARAAAPSPRPASDRPATP
jgi:hypothetical protein